MQPLRAFLSRKSQLLEASRHVCEGKGVALDRQHEGNDHLAALLVRDANDRVLAHRRMASERVFDFQRTDILALADDDVLLAPGDLQKAAIDAPSQIAHQEK